MDLDGPDHSFDLHAGYPVGSATSVVSLEPLARIEENRNKGRRKRFCDRDMRVAIVVLAVIQVQRTEALSRMDDRHADRRAAAEAFDRRVIEER
jgi:hypothetical protein